MATLDPEAGYVVLINTFTLEPDRADDLLAILSRATEEAMRHMPGFVSANLYVSRDKRHIANYAQWRGQSDIEAMMANPDAGGHMREPQLSLRRSSRSTTICVRLTTPPEGLDNVADPENSGGSAFLE